MEKIIKYDWTYMSKGDNETRTFEIITPDNKEKPKVLYKLYSLSDNSIDGLLNHYVYATHPAQFNDIFDCYENLLEFDDEDFIRFFIKTFAKEEYPEDRLNDDLKKNFKGVSTFVQRNFKEIIYGQFGVFSMTNNPSNLLMWAYYTNHQGFFIEFDIAKFPFKYHGPFPVNYQENIEAFSIKECGLPLGLLLQSNLKHSGWKHEEEWRLLIESEEPMVRPSFEVLRKMGGHDRKFKYPIEAIQTIGIGNRFFAPDELHIESDTLLNINLKYEEEKKSKFLDFLITNKINTCFVQRDGLIKISYGGMVIEKISDKKYVFNAGKWKPRES